MAKTQELYICLLLVAGIYNINAELQPEPPEEAETPGALESDIILTEEQRTSIEQQIEEFNNGGGIRKAHADLARRWPNGVVPYVISAQSEGDRAVIEKALKYWERVSCLTFPAYSAAAGHTSRINFMKNNNYCYSSVGVANPGGSQDVSIGTGCAQIGTIAHEIGHAIGFWHEQSRTDRDNFVVIHLENIKDGKEHNFNRYTADTINSYNVPYDLGSLMHYGTHYFSKNGQPTITAVNPDDNDLIGQRNSLSPADIQLANVIYSCYTNNYVRIGCFKDVTTDRAITTLEGTDARLDGSYHTRENPLQKCADVAGDLGYKIFALQNGGWCASAASAVETFAKYGVSQDCNADGEGGPGANDVYMFTNRRVYARLGCFGDTAVRAISTLEGTDSRLDGAYASREDAIEKCSQVARDLGHKVFAVQNGGWCASSASAIDTYNMYGTSRNCLADGEGGAYANDVYIFLDTPRYAKVGCFADVTTDRAIPTLEGTDSRLDGSYHTRTNPLQKCADVSSDKDFKIFALQNGGWCASSSDATSTFAKYGVSQACNADGEGGPGANDVYIFTNDLVYTSIGCYGDAAVRAIPTLEGTDSRLDGAYASRENPIEKCSQVASDLGYKVFAVQNGGWCASSATAIDTYNMYGTSTKCNKDGKGGAYANEVYIFFD